MTDQLEHELKQLFAEEAGRAPQEPDLIGGVRHLVRRRKVRRGWASVVLIAASAAGVLLISGGTLGDGDAPSSPAISTSASRTSAQHSSKNPQLGPVPVPASASCIIYSPHNVSTLAEFALDGTVRTIGPQRPSQSEAYPAVIPTTITVNEWYHGGSADAITVDIPTGPSIDPTAPPFRVGSRLLISGSKAQTDSESSELAWGCGYTRYYDKSTAIAWRTAAR
jgi:hypothetical protein